MFWNWCNEWSTKYKYDINRKHEMFWNKTILSNSSFAALLTVNMKCFEMDFINSLKSFYGN